LEKSPSARPGKNSSNANGRTRPWTSAASYNANTEIIYATRLVEALNPFSSLLRNRYELEKDDRISSQKHSINDAI